MHRIIPMGVILVAVLVGLWWHIHDDEADAALAAVLSLLALLIYASTVLQHFRQSGQARELDIRAANQADDLVRINAELSERLAELERARDELQTHEKRFALAMEASNEGLWDWDITSNDIYFGPRYYTLLGYEPGEFEPSFDAWLNLLHPEDGDIALAALNAHIRRETDQFEAEFRLRRKSGDYIWVLGRAKVVQWDSGGRPARMIGTHVDINERKIMEKQLRYQALHDPLTGLANRSLCLDHVANALARRKRFPEKHFAVVFMDLDRFKLVNDSLGHAFGDKLLRQVANRLLDSVRELDTVSRFGGDEFVILLEDLESPRVAINTVQRLRQEISRPFDLDGHGVSTSGSFGVVLSITDYEYAEDILQDANIAMHRSKEAGRNRLKVFSSRMREEASELMNLETDMRKALGGEEFALHYQPIVSLPALRPVSLEALARWPGHDNGAHPVSPLEFIPVAEESGLILELGDWALREACRQMSVWRTEMEWVRSMSVAVNLSARQFAQPQLALRIREGLVDCSMPAATLRLEVNEDTLMDRAERAVSILEDLRQSGVGICIDDFGTGCSSLSHLYRLPLDQVKIDIGFVRDVHTSSETREIVRAMVNLAHNLGLTTVAEGVEEKAQLDALVELGCDFAQGFYFAEPMTASETREYLGRLGRK